LIGFLHKTIYTKANDNLNQQNACSKYKPSFDCKTGISKQVLWGLVGKPELIYHALPKKSNIYFQQSTNKFYNIPDLVRGEFVISK